MTTVTAPLRAGHEDLVPGIDTIREAADAVGIAGRAELARLLARAHDFLLRDLVPHAAAEDRILYPAVEQVMGTPGATATMRRDHLEIGFYANTLGELRYRVAEGMAPENEASELRRVLYGLHALVTLHLAKEEETYLPLLDEHLDVDQVDELTDAMHAAARHERALAVR